MELSLEHPGDHLFIRSFDGERITVVDQAHELPLLLSASTLVTDWSPARFENLDLDAVERLCELHPEIVILGAGDRQTFLPPRLQAAFYQRGVGVEVMTVDAACRTFNILVSESRNVLAALMLSS